MFIDANEHVSKKSLSKSLIRTSGLAMNKMVGTFVNEPRGTTFFRGSNPINGIWASSDPVATCACLRHTGRV